MKFHGKISLIQRPKLWGKSYDKHFNHYVKSSCHEFSVDNVQVRDKYMKYSSKVCSVDEVPSLVTYIAGKYPEGFLHGPASSLKSKTIIYPCDSFKCQLDCPCHLCRFKQPCCITASSTSNFTCGDCSFCRQDYDDHLLHHWAHHVLCKFCIQLYEIFPQFSYTVLQKTSHRGLDLVPVKSFIFWHVYNDTFHKEAVSSQYNCDNCHSNFKRKADLRRHEICQHFGLKHMCMLCGNNFTRYENLLQHKENVHGRNETLQCEKCDEIFTKKSSFQRHIDGSVHEDGSSKNACNVCDADFCTKRKLLKHIQSHTTHECPHCQKIFVKKQSLEMHMAKRQEKLCSVCGKTLCNMSDLNSHCLQHKYVQCSVCGKDYLEASISGHKLMNHSHDPGK